MAKITLRILDGTDRGRIFNGLEPPISLGREEGNTIQLNDERVSRFHAKIQLDHDDFVLTDLESTNGTKVNGEQVQLKILRHGDTVTLGRSTILVGSRSDIQRRLAKISDTNGLDREKTESSGSLEVAEAQQLQQDTDLQLKLLELEPPALPERLSPGQAAQLAEALDFFHLRIRRITKEARLSKHQDGVRLSSSQWQNLLDLQSRLAEYLREIGRPHE